MTIRKYRNLIPVIAMVCAPVHAQDLEDQLAQSRLEAEMQKAEAQLVQQEREREALHEQAQARQVIVARQVDAGRARAERQVAEAARQVEEVEKQRVAAAQVRADRAVEVEVRMREAEQALAAAAQQMAELSRRQLPNAAYVERIVRTGHGPVLGVTIGGSDKEDPVEGVDVTGVSPGGAAAEAGVRAGDVITSINGESLSAENSRSANEKLLDFMQGVETGDELSVEFMRNGKLQTVELKPRTMNSRSFVFDFNGDDFVMPDAPFPPRVAWISGRNGFGDMELVKLTEELGSYFGTSEGLLVVRAPENADLQLKDGDVIQNIDGRVPSSAAHAMRILGSYESGEKVRIEVMRNKRKQTVSIDVPDDVRSFASPAGAPAPRAVHIRPGGVVVPGNERN